MPRKVTQRDYKKLSEKVYEFYETKHRMPSFQELTNIFTVSSKDTVARIVEDLVNLEFIDKDKNGKLLPKFERFKSQNYRPKKTLSQKVFSLKMLGLVEAGFPSFVDAEDLETISLEDWLVGDKTATFILKVKGESMIEAGIMDGDYVIVERGPAQAGRAAGFPNAVTDLRGIVLDGLHGIGPIWPAQTCAGLHGTANYARSARQLT